MIRQPTPASTAYRWHAEAIAGKEPAVHETEPQPGFFKRRLVKDGAEVPAAIWIESDVDVETGELVSDEHYLCEVAGEMRDPLEEWSFLAKTPITEAEYRALHALMRRVKIEEPDHPLANPRKPIDVRAMMPF